jgi:hypothetical protein
MDFGFGEHVKTVLVCPSISFPAVELRKITGIEHYEERMLFMLLTLDDPGVRIIYVTSLPIDDAIIDYYLGFVRDPDDARRRLRLVSLDDAEPRALTAKLLERPDAVRALGALVGEPETAFLLPFNVTSWEAELCEQLGLPVYGPPPALSPLGSKSGARRLARELAVEILDGAEDLWSVEATERAIAALLRRRPDARTVVIKLNNGFSGQGNAIIEVDNLRAPLTDSPTVFCAEEESWSSFGRKIEAGGAVVEELVRRRGMASPSVQMRALPTGLGEVVSTHDQVLGGPDDQVYLGCRFPARREHRDLIRERAERIGRGLAARGVIGSFGIDFIAFEEDGQTRAFMSEINLRVGGTTHPFAMAQLATGGRYDVGSGELIAEGRAKRYVATDNLKSARLKGLEPRDVIEAVEKEGIAFDRSSGSGVTLHLLGALPRYGKMGAACIADSHERADELYGALLGALEIAAH